MYRMGLTRLRNYFTILQMILVENVDLATPGGLGMHYIKTQGLQLKSYHYGYAAGGAITDNDLLVDTRSVSRKKIACVSFPSPEYDGITNTRVCCELNGSKMVRKLKYHEQKLLKKVDFINWEVDNNLHEVKVLRKYHIEKREDYTKYNKLSRNVRDLAQKIRDLDDKDGFRAQCTSQLLEKLYCIGLVPTKQSLALTEKVTASAFCRRRLPSIMVNLRMAQNLKTAITFIEQGHVRVGPEIITDPAFLITRNMEDFVTWVDSSKIKQHVMNYNEERDDFDLVV